MAIKYYVVIKNNLAHGLMETVGGFVAHGDAYLCAKLFNEDLASRNDFTREYGVTDNPMIWKGKAV